MAEVVPESISYNLQQFLTHSKWDHRDVTDHVAPADVQLYLPEKWRNHPKRCERACVPETERKFRTKSEFAPEMVWHAREYGLYYGSVWADALTGKNAGFCLALEEMGETFVVDMHSDFTVYLKDPEPYLPEKAVKAGRPLTKYQSHQKSI